MIAVRILAGVILDFHSWLDCHFADLRLFYLLLTLTRIAHHHELLLDNTIVVDIRLQYVIGARVMNSCTCFEAAEQEAGSPGHAPGGDRRRMSICPNVRRIEARHQSAVKPRKKRTGAWISSVLGLMSRPGCHWRRRPKPSCKGTPVIPMTSCSLGSFAFPKIRLASGRILDDLPKLLKASCPVKRSYLRASWYPVKDLN